MAIKVNGNMVADWEDKTPLTAYGDKFDRIKIGDSTAEEVVLPGRVGTEKGFKVSQAVLTHTRSIKNREGANYGICWKPDGSRMYTAGDSSDGIIEYIADTPFDLSSTRWYKHHWKFGEIGTVRGLFFRPDGRSVYIHGATYKQIMRYDMLIPWDLETLSRSDHSPAVDGDIYVGDQDSAPNGIALSPDGTTMIVLGDTGEDLLQYTLSVPFDIKSADFEGNVPGGDWDVFGTVATNSTNNGGDISVSPDGNKFFIINARRPVVVQEFAVTNGSWDFSGGFSYTREYVFDEPGDNVAYAEGFDWNGDGSKFYILGLLDDFISEYSVSSNYSLQGVTKTGKTYRSHHHIVNASSLKFWDDGKKVLITGTSSDTITQLECPTPYSLSGARFLDQRRLGFDTPSIRMIYPLNDGTKLYFGGSSGDSVAQVSFPPSRKYDLSVMVPDNTWQAVTAESYDMRAIAFSQDGRYMFTLNLTGSQVLKYELSIPWHFGDINNNGTVTFVESIGIEQKAANALLMRQDGLRFFIAGTSGDYIHSYAMTEPYNLSTARLEERLSISNNGETAPSAIGMSPDGTRFYRSGTGIDDISEYVIPQSRLDIDATVSVGGNLTVGGTVNAGSGLTAGMVEAGAVRTEILSVDDNISFTGKGSKAINASMLTDIGGLDEDRTNLEYPYPEGTEVYDAFWYPDGTRLYTIEQTQRKLKQWDLSKAYDMGTAVWNNVEVDLADLAGLMDATSIWFKSDGTQCVITDKQSFSVHSFDLSTGWDLTTMTYNGDPQGDTSPGDVYGSETYQRDGLTAFEGFIFNNNGTKIFTLCSSTNAVYEYTTSTAWNPASPTYVGKLDIDTYVAEDNAETATTGGVYAQLLKGIRFNNNGTKMYLMDQTSAYILGFNLGTAYSITSNVTRDIGTMVSSPANAMVTGAPDGIYVNSGGTRVLTVDSSSIHSYTMSAHDPSTLTVASSLSVDDSTSNGRPPIAGGCGLTASNNGQFIFVADNAKESIFRLDLSTGYDLTTATMDRGPVTTANLQSHGTYDANKNHSYLFDDGTRLYEQVADRLYQYDLSTPYDVTSVTYVRDITLVLTDNGYNQSGDGFWFSTDGTKLFWHDNAGDFLRYTLSTAWDISTLSTLPDQTSIGGTISSVDPTLQIGLDNTSAADSISFDPSGTRMYVMGGSYMHQYNLDTAWDITSFKLESVYSGAQSVSSAHSITWASDGYVAIVTNTHDEIYMYRAGTPYELATLWASSSCNVTGQEGPAREINARSAQFSPDGMKLFFSSRYGYYHEKDLTAAFEPQTADWGQWINSKHLESSLQGLTMSVNGLYLYTYGTANDRITQYNLSTAWDLETATYYNYEAGLQNDTAISDIAISNDGTKIFYFETTWDQIQEYTLTTPYDIDTATNRRAISYSNLGTPQAIVMSGGTRFYVADGSSDRIVKIDMTSANDIYALDMGETFSFGVQEQTPAGFTFGDSGSKLYIIGRTGDEINQYNLSTPYSIQTATFDSNLRINGYETNPEQIEWKSDGTKFYVLGRSGNSIYTYSVTTAWDVTTTTNGASYDDRQYIGHIAQSPRGMMWKPDNGGRIFIGCGVTKRIYDINNSAAAPWGFDTINNDNFLDTRDEDDLPTGIYIGDNGNKLFITGEQSDDIYSYNLSTPYDISTGTAGVELLTSLGLTYPRDVVFKPDGTQVYLMGGFRPMIAVYNLSTPWDLSTSTYHYGFYTGKVTQYYQSSSIGYGQRGFDISSDGKHVVIANDYYNTVTEFQLPVAWDFKSYKVKSLDGHYAREVGDTTVDGTNVGTVTMSNDGTRLFTTGGTQDRMITFSLSIPYDISSASFLRDLTGLGSAPYFHIWKPDGTTVYIGDATTDAILQRDMTTPWDTSTVVTSTSFSVHDNEHQYGIRFNSGMAFTPDGSRIFVVDNYACKVVQFDLSTPWDITTAVGSAVASLKSGGSHPWGIYLSANGSRMIIVDDERDALNEWSMSKPWDITTIEWKYGTRLDMASMSPAGFAIAPDGRSMLFSNRHSDQLIQIPFETNVSIEGAVDIMGSLSILNNSKTLGNVTNYASLGFDTETPVGSIDASSRSDGIVFPVGTDAERPTNPINGMARYNTTRNKLEVYANGAWTDLH